MTQTRSFHDNINWLKSISFLKSTKSLQFIKIQGLMFNHYVTYFIIHISSNEYQSSKAYKYENSKADITAIGTKTFWILGLKTNPTNSGITRQKLVRRGGHRGKVLMIRAFIWEPPMHLHEKCSYKSKVNKCAGKLHMLNL